jgi:hypothetical protein
VSATGTGTCLSVPQQGTYQRFFTIFVIFLSFFADPPDTSLTSRDLHVGQMDTLPVLS